MGSGLVTRNSFPFCLLQVPLYFKGMLNSKGFYKKIFSHVIPVRIIVSWPTGKFKFLFLRVLTKLLFWEEE